LASTIEHIHSYCAMCTSRCGVVATVADGKFVGVHADPDHPNGCICVKGTAAPEIVYSPDRLRSPLMRTRPKRDPNPGWVEVTWDQALSLAALRLNDIKENHGAQAVVFSRATTAGSAAVDFDVWLQRLANAFGSPNLLTSNHICTWNRRVGSTYTYGSGMPTPDFDHANCMLLWGINPQATSPAQARRIARARKRGAKLIVIDPRKNTLAEKADCWLRVKPGTDGELGMAMIHVLLEEDLFDAEFARRWTNAPFLVRCDNGRLLTGQDLFTGGNPGMHLAWDERNKRPIDAAHGGAQLALSGIFDVELRNSQSIKCRPVFGLLRDAAAAFAPERSQAITTVPAQELRQAVRMFAREKPSCYCTWVGLEQDSDAMQTNRAVCIFYALTGQFDGRGSNVLFGAPPLNIMAGRELLPKDKAALRLGLKAHPLGPPADTGLVQAAETYEAILNEHPYAVKAMVLFGSDPLLGHGDPLRGKAAFEALEFYVHADMFSNPSAQFADLLLPAASCWEREALMPSFDIAEDTVNWLQLRPAVVPPLHQSKPDTEIIFSLAAKLGLGEQFFNGDITAALDHQLAPLGLRAQELRRTPGGVRVNSATRYQKYAELEVATGGSRGFDTPSGKIEIFSTIFANAGYAPLPDFSSARDGDERFPLVLTFFRDIHFCDEQHRNIPRLRRAVREPFLELHPGAAKAKGVADGEWVWLETAGGKVKLKAKFNDALHPQVVATVYGWWQPCEELQLAGYHPFDSDGANTNLLIHNSDNDPISASVAHRGQPCRISRCATIRSR
jgi:anaerobic selenocysteine-containing dehydrogenase